ncbi:zinc finger MYM-type protein 1-like [Dendropsophus ebraccatus]|uniref:zinc finger MYM-type protein 1-like n=1 Tax=Dendropsophus ebraccatus TaxID=150705 RepID=UPI003831E057
MLQLKELQVAGVCQISLKKRYDGTGTAHGSIINMESSKSKSKIKGGAQKAREKRTKELELAGKDPKQMKLSFTGATDVAQKKNTKELLTVQSDLSNPPEVVHETEADLEATFGETEVFPESSSLSSFHRQSHSPSQEEPGTLSEQDSFIVEEGDDLDVDVSEQERIQVEEGGDVDVSEQESNTLEEGSDLDLDVSEQECIHVEEGEDLNVDVSEQDSITVEEGDDLNVDALSSGLRFVLSPSSSIAEKIAFVEQHPYQPTTMDCDNIPFKEAEFYYRKKPNGDHVIRSWLTLKVVERKIEAFFCSICIAFSKAVSPFISGCTNFRHCHQAVKKHESSNSHCDAANAYLIAKKDKNIETLINKIQASKRKKEILQNIEVMKRIFDVVKLLGKQGLPFRAHGTNESLYNLNNSKINHGNFLEIILLLSHYDVPLKNHLEKCIQESERRKKHLQKRGKVGKMAVGRGSLVTFLSYKTINKVVMAVVRCIKESIVSEIGEKRYTIQVDSTQDAGIVDQATVVLRYVKNEEVQERLISVLPVTDASGQGLNELLMANFKRLGLDYLKIAGESFDGAANMRSSYVGLRAQIAKIVPDSIYIWCYCHILNLCISDCCDVLEAKNFFGLLNRLASFIGDSHKRMHIWSEQLQKRQGKDKLLRLQKIGETRWWAKEKALNWLFGEKQSLYLDAVEVLFLISQLRNCDSRTSSEATSLYEKLCEFQTILTANVFLPIFDVIGPVSKYLQTSGLDYMVAWTMIENAIDQLKKIEFEHIKESATHFALQMNDIISRSEIVSFLKIETEIPARRVPRKKRMAGEISADERPSDEIQRFRMEVYRPIFDQILVSLTERFSENKQLVADTQFLHPRFFEDIRTDPKRVKPGSLKRISELAKVNEDALISELVSFANLFPKLTGHLDETERTNVSSEGDGLEEEDEWGVLKEEDKSTCKSCKNCFLCCHRLLLKYNLYSAAYETLSVTYEYLLTLSFTQVACERAFSKLKLIKTRLRVTMGQELLEALMIMSVERDLLELVQFQDVLEIVRESSPLMRSLLTV